MPWTRDDIPDQSGRVAIVTGANTGLGFATASALAEKGARVILACRDVGKGEAAAERIRASGTDAAVECRRLDLSDLDQIRDCAEDAKRDLDRLDRLVNNAGVMMCPEGRTAQGFEMQFGVNHLGHFALTGRLLPLLRDTPGSRVATLSSVAHRQGRMEFDDLDFRRRRYRPAAAYARSKLANLLFSGELHRRLDAEGANVLSVAAHPGWTRTDLQRHSLLARALSPVFGMGVERGCLPTLRAATDPTAAGDDYFGPDGFLEMNGHPVRVGRTKRAANEEDAARLWAISEERTGLPFLPA